MNDIVSGRIAEFGEILLNENGLFSTYEEAEDFLEYRAKLEKETAKYRFEKGDYVIYKLTEVEI